MPHLGLSSVLHKSKDEEPIPKQVPIASDQSHLNGHVGHLTPEREQALNQFRALITEKGIYRPATEQTKASHDEATLLRFLRARKFDVQGAYAQFADTEVWREKNQIQWLYDTIEVEEYEEARRVYPQWIGRRDKRGIPVYVYEIAHLNSKTMKAYDSHTNSPASIPSSPARSGATTPDNMPPRQSVDSEYTPNAAYVATSAPTTSKKLLRLFALYENLSRFVFPLCTAMQRPNMETPISCTNNIVDVSGVGLMQFWNLKGHMQDASTLATAHYPETLDRIFIIGAPSFFPTVWSWIKKWFDPGTTSKIFILSSSEVEPVLKSFIDEQNIPVKYGGSLQWKWGQHPLLDDEAMRVVGKMPGGWVEGPLGFVEDLEAERLARRQAGLQEIQMKIEALGSERGSRRKGVVSRYSVDMGNSLIAGLKGMGIDGKEDIQHGHQLETIQTGEVVR